LVLEDWFVLNRTSTATIGLLFRLWRTACTFLSLIIKSTNSLYWWQSFIKGTTHRSLSR